MEKRALSSYTKRVLCSFFLCATRIGEHYLLSFSLKFLLSSPSLYCTRRRQHYTLCFLCGVRIRKITFFLCFIFCFPFYSEQEEKNIIFFPPYIGQQENIILSLYNEQEGKSIILSHSYFEHEENVLYCESRRKHYTISFLQGTRIEDHCSLLTLIKKRRTIYLSILL